MLIISLPVVFRPRQGGIKEAVDIYGWAPLIVAFATFLLTAVSVSIRPTPLRKFLFALSCVTVVVVAVAVVLVDFWPTKDPGSGADSRRTTATTAAIMNGPWQGDFNFDHTQVGLTLTISSDPDGQLTAVLTIYKVSDPFIPAGSVAMSGDCTATSVSLTFNHWIGQSAGHGLIQLHGAAPPNVEGTFSGTLNFLFVHTTFSVHKE